MFNFLTQKFSSIFSSFNGNTKLTESNIDDALKQVSESLLEADVPNHVVIDFINQIKQETLGKEIIKSLNPGQQFIKIVYERLCEFLGGKNAIAPTFQIPSVIMVLGLQGSGKTTTVAKLANYLQDLSKKKGKTRKILLGSVDFYRPAAIDQLEILSKQVNVEFYRSSQADVIKAAKEIYNQFKQKEYDYLILDTAGRLHIDNKMLQELQEINLILEPKYKILVLDSMTGQESLKVAQAFDQNIGFNSAILTKLDSETRAGAAFAFRYILKKPISFIGSGEKIEDLELFYPERMATRILGMGDVLTLVEKAESKIKKSEQDRLANAISSGNFTLQDFASQLDMVGNLGSLSKIMQYLPGMGSVKLTPEIMEKGEAEVKKFKAILNSMTVKEKVFPRILDNSRKQRIAKGSGTIVIDVNLLLEKFEQSKQFAKLFKRHGNFKDMFK